MNLYQRLRLLHRARRYARRTEPNEIALVRAMIHPGDFVVDIGAHKAAFAYWMAKAVGPLGAVVAFEPIPELAEYLRQVAGTFRDRRLSVVEAAASDRHGVATLHFAGRHLGGASLEIAEDVMRPSIQVITMTLDDELPKHTAGRRVSFIKCDVEEHELAVFRGAERTVSRDKPMLLFESRNLLEGSTVQGVFQFLVSLGFTGFFFDRGTLTPLAEYDPRKHTAPPGNENFVFTHPGRVRWQSLAPPYAVEFISAGRS